MMLHHIISTSAYWPPNSQPFSVQVDHEQFSPDRNAVHEKRLLNCPHVVDLPNAINTICMPSTVGLICTELAPRDAHVAIGDLVLSLIGTVSHALTFLNSELSHLYPLPICTLLGNFYMRILARTVRVHSRQRIPQSA